MKLDTIYNADCLVGMRALPDNSVDAVVTDPPYGLKFMGRKWDYDVPSVEVWSEVLRVLKPGGHALSFGGTRTYHRMACAIEDAGFEIRDQLAWIYGSGFPKSLDISKAMDKQAGAKRAVVTRVRMSSGGTEHINRNNKAQGFRPGEYQKGQNILDITVPATDAAKQWDGFGTALKPATEPICLARKPLGEATVAKNVLKWGTGALNVDGCRIEGKMDGVWGTSNKTINRDRKFNASPEMDEYRSAPHLGGRWPANVLHDGSEEVLSRFPQSSVTGKRSAKSKSAQVTGTAWLNTNHESTEYTDTGSAARFFYCAKASRKERGEECNHPTVKPISLIRYLSRLITPPSGIVLDPFMGSGTTALACIAEEFHYVGFEHEKEYLAIAQKRIREHKQRPLALVAA